MESLSNGDECYFENIKYITPISILPISAVLNCKDLVARLPEGTCSDYLKTMKFPSGVPIVTDEYLNKTYIPIIHLTVESSNRQWLSYQLTQLHEQFLELLRSNIIADPTFIQFVTDTTLGFLVGETLDNIEEHANARNIYIFAQYWRKSNSCEICILDDGDGLYGSLNKAGRDVTDSLDALKKIIEKGLSAKTGDPDSIRGTGIKNMRDSLINQEINGEFILISGNAGFFQSSQHEQLITIRDYFWNGTILAMKINKPLTVFNMYRYVR
ncbi:MAG: hypothetical protein ISS17_05700 [Bacteroidales bacterium]|nr:hypothetical protein [Bacteroidales bacterium]